ncbi:MAG TPA: hypothetical protein VFV67_11370 [Actinophytocola sp.]|uniref:hypothetical protein n=1 Tax=Actinophytocola sp. TaxID=1872138 RepID=UPI002DBFA63A|nr:hypothetical protein [Actinophytocola sp.]HEU5471244.1 hypothetical protein [Actinophytocola sp.]
MFLSFAKVCDADRDFLIVRGTGRELDWAAVAMRMCRRRTGIGAGALLVTNRVGYTGFRLDAYGVDGRPRRTDDRAVRSAAVVLHEDYGVKELLVETPAGRRWVRLAVDPLKVAVAHRSLWVWGEPELICTGELRWARRAPEGMALPGIRWG